MSINRSIIRRRAIRRLMIRPLLWVMVWVILSAASINAQQQAPEAPRAGVGSSPGVEMGNAGIPVVDRDYRISAGDVIQLQIEDAPELSHFYRVNSAGFIEMPVLEMVEAQKRTTFELARIIAKRLREAEYLKTPNVLVTIKQYYSQTFFIQGSVRNPGVYQTEGYPSLLTMIGLAGGLAGDHGSVAFILRPRKQQKQGPDPNNQTSQDQAATPGLLAQFPGGVGDDSPPDSDYDLVRVNIGALYKGQDDQRLEPGDIVNIPRADVFFVSGEVRAPGSFPLKDGTTLRQAIALAQGMTFNAKSSRGIIFREDPLRGSREEIMVDIADVMDGKRADIPILANDVIIVPNSRTKSVGSVLLTAFGYNAARL
ncbi:MAG: polysaccharide biosynthesis/export family protein, partial [Blastocatellia bacterium]|nr:polysaccharide biosynthesis/export family protein [Blastocatellia bacterium]